MRMTPVIQGYVLGKSQEITRLLTDAGIPVLQHRSIYEVSRMYESLRLSAGPLRAFPRPCRTGLGRHRSARHAAGELPRQVRFALTGWAMDRGAKYRLGVDHAIPLSDHADYDELLRGDRPRRAAGGLLHARAGEFCRSALGSRLQRAMCWASRGEGRLF